MSATIKVGVFEATLDGWEWAEGDAWFVDRLNAMLDPEGPSGSDPAPDLHEAQRVAKELGGQVIRFDKPEYVEGTVY